MGVRGNLWPKYLTTLVGEGVEMIAYTDGACNPNPGKGAFAWCLIKDQKLIDDFVSKTIEDTTNNRMEYEALISVIKTHGHSLKKILTDSRLLVNTCNDWRHLWKKKKWKKKGSPIKNLDLVIQIDELLNFYPHILVEWVRGHNGNEWNEHVDELCNSKVMRML